MLETILNKILVVFFLLSIFNAFRHGYYFIQAMFKTNEEGLTSKYMISTKSLFLLGLSLAYALSAIFTGITI
jgi:Sec-independent protein secretion pathway component TatC